MSFVSSIIMWNWNIIGGGDGGAVDPNVLKIGDRVILTEEAFEGFLNKCKEVYSIEYVERKTTSRESLIFKIIDIISDDHSDTGSLIYQIHPDSDITGKFFSCIDTYCYGTKIDWVIDEHGTYKKVKSRY